MSRPFGLSPSRGPGGSAQDASDHAADVRHDLGRSAFRRMLTYLAIMTSVIVVMVLKPV
ncbi:MAG TPA: hypothetical protein VNS10_00660 [Gemmatimonadaceae bacterium]|nr:hypothetical protein [Gemmatimonadaceae bacterium]